MGFDTYFGFDLIQRKTLAKLLADAGLSTEQTAAVALVAALPTTDPGDGVSIWNNAGSLEVATGP
jgi:hypothetical protein